MVTFTDVGPDIYEDAVEKVKARKGEWAFLEDVPRRRIEGLRKRHPDVEIVGQGINKNRSRYEKVWFRCPA